MQLWKLHNVTSKLACEWTLGQAQSTWHVALSHLLQVIIHTWGHNYHYVCIILSSAHFSSLVFRCSKVQQKPRTATSGDIAFLNVDAIIQIKLLCVSFYSASFLLQLKPWCSISQYLLLDCCWWGWQEWNSVAAAAWCSPDLLVSSASKQTHATPTRRKRMWGQDWHERSEEDGVDG